MQKVIGKSPTRVDLAGGTLDLWPIYNLLPKKATVNFGVDLPATAIISRQTQGSWQLCSEDQGQKHEGRFADLCHSDVLPLLGLCLAAVWSKELGPISIRTSAKSPAGAGLGGSSCLALTVVTCLQKLRAHLTGEPEWRDHQIVETAKNLEAKLIAAPTGTQDYWGPARGGVNILEFPYSGETVETIFGALQTALEERLVLCYSGKSRQSAINNWQIFKSLFDGDKALLAQLSRLGELAEACAEAVRAGKVDEALEYSAKEWMLRKAAWPAVETTETKAIDGAALAAGAKFSRVCGAGGGGVMAIFIPPDKRSDVIEAVQQVGGTVLVAGVAKSGTQVELI